MSQRNLYLVERVCDYDEACGYVIAADTPTQARQIASVGPTTKVGRQRIRSWRNAAFLDPKRATCKRIGYTTRRRGVILGSFLHG